MTGGEQWESPASHKFEHRAAKGHYVVKRDQKLLAPYSALSRRRPHVVRPFIDLKFGAYAHKRYIDEFGQPDSERDFGQHKFVRWQTQASGMPFSKWFEDHVPEASITLSSQNLSVTESAILNAMGIGFVSELEATPKPGLVRVLPSASNWSVQLWLVTHVDLHRSPKIQAFFKTLKETIAIP